MEDLGSFMLNGLYLHQVWRVFPGSVPAADRWRGFSRVQRAPDDSKSQRFVTVRPSADVACSLQPAGSVSWPGGTSAREAAERYWEETNPCTAKAAPNLSPHYTCTHGKKASVLQADDGHPSAINALGRGLVCVLDVVVRQLLQDLTENLILQRFGLQGSFEDLICELINGAHALGRVVAHVLHHRYSRRQGQHQRLTLNFIISSVDL